MLPAPFDSNSSSKEFSASENTHIVRRSLRIDRFTELCSLAAVLFANNKIKMLRPGSSIIGCLIMLGLAKTAFARGEEFSTCPKRLIQDEIPFNPFNYEVFFLDGENGMDEWNGKFPVHRKNDVGPFRSLGVALSKMRQARRHSNRNATLFIKTGTYFVEETITLDNRDAHTHLVSFPTDPEVPKIIGGLRLPGSGFSPFNQATNGPMIYASRFEGSCSSHVFLGNKRLLRARKPNIARWTGDDLTGSGPYLYMTGLLETTDKCDFQGRGGFKQKFCPNENKHGFRFRSGDISRSWRTLERGEILVFNSWTAQRGKIAYVDEENDIVRFKHPLRFPIGMHPKPSGYRYVIENIMEELDAVGEFYCDQERQLLFVIPPEDALEREDVFIAQNSALFRLRRTNDVSFSGLQFSYTHDKNFEGYNSKPAAVEIEESRNVRINRCEFSNMGYTAVYAANTVGLKITNSLFRDVGYQGVSVELNRPADDELANRDVLVHGNTFYGCGVSSMFQPSCVHVKGVRNIRVTGNDVSHTSYAGIRVGWQKVFTLDYVQPDEYVFQVTDNNIHNYGEAILNDFAGVYLSSNMEDCGVKQNMSICHIHALIANNAIHHSQAYYYGAMGVYGDTAVSSITVKNNWIYRLHDTAINFHCGQNNVASNNMINHISRHRVFGTCNGAVGPGGIPHQNLTFVRNVIYVVHEDPRMWSRGDIWWNAVPKLDNNDYYFVSASQQEIDEFFPKEISFSEWKSNTGNDVSSVIENPMFVDVEQDDYRLQETSPALSLGINSVDMKKVIKHSGAC